MKLLPSHLFNRNTSKTGLKRHVLGIGTTDYRAYGSGWVSIQTEFSTGHWMVSHDSEDAKTPHGKNSVGATLIVLLRRIVLLVVFKIFQCSMSIMFTIAGVMWVHSGHSVQDFSIVINDHNELETWGKSPRHRNHRSNSFDPGSTDWVISLWLHY